MQKGSEETEEFYIGKTSLLRDGEFTPLVIDWRAPIANLYYEGRLGQNTYESEGELYEGELLLKRQVNIEEGQLVDILDVDITTNDAFLQASLEANADQRLKDIASTIQAEQNRVIRANMREPLIVQGVAGSGKTTIALHRIAYFIYTYGATFDPDTFMIIAPNRLFINYISEVLPELGVEKVKQTTFVDFVEELLGKKLNLVDKNEKLMNIIHRINHELELWSTEFKGSLEYKEGIESYLSEIEKHFTPTIHFTFAGEILASRVEIRSLFLDHYRYLPITIRIHEIKRLLTHRLKSEYKTALLKTETEYNNRIDVILRKEEAGEERRAKVVDLMDERDTKLDEIRKENKTAVKEYMSHFKSLEYTNVYDELMTSPVMMEKHFGTFLSLDQMNYHIELTRKLNAKRKYELEDLSALLYIKYRIQGFDTPLEVTTIVIDEAQDFSLFQFFVLKHVIKTPRLTLLGDLSQGIHSYRGIRSWQDVMTKVFPENSPRYMTLVQSYRTTIEIMSLANEVLSKLGDPDLVYASPVIRHGEEPTINYFGAQNKLFEALENRVDVLRNKGYKSIAILCKTQAECLSVKKAFDKNKRHSAKVLDEKEEHYSAGVMLVPSYFAKGLEFDAVLITTVTESYTEHPTDVKLLYVAMTRSLHHLDLYLMDGSMPVLHGKTNIVS